MTHTCACIMMIVIIKERGNLYMSAQGKPAAEVCVATGGVGDDLKRYKIHHVAVVQCGRQLYCRFTNVGDEINIQALCHKNKTRVCMYVCRRSILNGDIFF